MPQRRQPKRHKLLQQAKEIQTVVLPENGSTTFKFLLNLLNIIFHIEKQS
jgi:hypothetical protein